MTFSERAKPLKDKSGMKLNEIAAACNISESMASRYINGSVIPPEDVARKMLEFLGAETDKTTEEETDMQTALAMLREVYEARIEDIFKNISDLKEQINHEKREKWIFFVLLAVVVVFVFALFYVDLSNGSVGWLLFGAEIVMGRLFYLADKDWSIFSIDPIDCMRKECCSHSFFRDNFVGTVWEKCLVVHKIQ